MKKFFVTLAIAIAFATVSVDAQTAYIWKESTTQLPEQTLNNPRITEGIEVYGKSGTLIIRTPIKTSVKVLSILGQTISQATINPGTHELPLNAHGIYIVKVGDYTLRVAL